LIFTISKTVFIQTLPLTLDTSSLDEWLESAKQEFHFKPVVHLVPWLTCRCRVQPHILIIFH